MRLTVVELIGVALGTLLCVLPYLVYGATFPPIAITSVALAVAAAGLALLRPGARWKTGAGVGFGLLAMIVVRIIVDYTHDPTSHNLAGIEVVIGLVIGLPPAVLGVLLGNLVRQRVPWPEVGGIALVMLALGVAAVSATANASNILRVEALAENKVAALIAAQREFRAAHPLRGYTCDLGELGVPFSGPIKKNRPSASYRLAGVVYRGGTGVTEGEYHYSLQCQDKPDPQELFVLTVRDWNQLGSRPLDNFCAGPDGTIRVIGRGKLYSCFAEGQIVRSVN